MIYVIGDSHTRTFANNSNFFPLFVGPGKEICFISEEHFSNVKERVARVIPHLDDSAVVMFVLGEPDTRYYLGKGWTPWEPQISHDIENPFELLDLSVARYKAFLKWFSQTYNFKAMVFNVVPSSRLIQNEYAKYMNKKLEEYCAVSRIPFINIQDQIVSQGVVRQDYMGDVVHLDASVQPLIEAQIRQSGIDLEINQPSEQREINNIKSDFVYDPRFACFTYQPGEHQFRRKLEKLGTLIRSVLIGKKDA